MTDIEKFVYYSNGSKKVLKPTDRIVVGSGGLALEGETSNDYETELAVVDPTADRTITFPNATGNVLIDSQDLSLNDNIKIKLGTGNDLEIFHDGTNSIIKDTADSGGSTIKYLAGTQTFQNKDANKTMAVFNAAGSVDLHHNGVKKFETTSSGIQTTGTLSLNGAYSFPTADGTSGQMLTTNGSGQLSFVDVSSSIAEVVDDTTPQLGGNLDPNGFGISNHLNPSASNSYKLGNTSTTWADLYLGDSSNIFFGEDQDVYFTHTHNGGLTLNMSAAAIGASDPNFMIRANSSNTTAAGPLLQLQKVTTAANDTIGKFIMRGNTDYHLMIETKLLDATADSEYSSVDFRTMSGGSSASLTTTSGLKIEGQSGSTTPKVKISNAYYLPTADGTANQILQTDGSGNLSFADASSGLSNIVEDTTPQLGGDLDLNGNGISSHLIPASTGGPFDIGSTNAEWRTVYLRDSGKVIFGADQDVQFEHVHNLGLQVRLTQPTANNPKFILSNSANATSGATLTFHKHNSFDADNDIVGKQEYIVASNAIITPDATYAEVSTVINSNSSDFEEGAYKIKVAAIGALATGLTVEGRNSESTPYVKIVDNYYLPNLTPNEGEIIKGTATSGETTFGKLKDTIMAELSIPGLDLQTDTNAFRFNCPVDLDIVGLDLYLDQHSTSGNVTVTVTNTTDSSSIQSLTISGTSLSASAYPYDSASAGDVITFAITATPANAQGLRAVLHIERKA